MTYKDLILNNDQIDIEIKSMDFIYSQGAVRLPQHQNGVSYTLSAVGNPRSTVIILLYFKAGKTTIDIQGKELELGKMVVERLIKNCQLLPALW